MRRGASCNAGAWNNVESATAEVDGVRLRRRCTRPYLSHERKMCVTRV